MATIDVLDVRRVGQISGTTGYRWPHLVDPVGNPLLVDTGRWNVHGVDLGANAKHSDGRLYIFFGDVGTNMSNHPPQDSDLVAWTDPFLSPLGNRANRIGASAGRARSSTSRVRVSTESAHAAAHTAQLD